MILREPAIGLPALCLSAALLAGCAAVPAEDRPSSIPRIILDTDVGSSTDDLFALAMLYRYEEQGRCRLLGVVVDRPGEANAAFVDAMNAWAGRADLPVALVRDGPADARVFIDYASVADLADARVFIDYASVADLADAPCSRAPPPASGPTAGSSTGGCSRRSRTGA